VAVDGSVDEGLKVVYIGGGTKSGSTLLDLMLGEVSGFFSVGELRQIWQRGLAEDSHCGCRQRFSECPFWTKVGEEGFGGWDKVDLDEVLRLRNSLDRIPSLRQLKSARAQPEREEDLSRYVSILHALLEAIRKVSGADVIVDSSKTPSHALLLDMVPGVDLRLVHLVRDSRGVVFSWKRADRGKRRKRKLLSLRARLGISLSACARWYSYNARMPSVGKLGVPYLLMRYEDLVGDPRPSLERILDHAGSRADGLTFIGPGNILLHENHTVYGNRLRFSTGELPLRVDDAWRQGLSVFGRAWITAMTFPLLRRYGYPLGRGAGATSLAPSSAG
jgi:hypothetical protein